ncbi:flagellar rod assembly protein FlgJ [Salmonella enterica subsp. enterica]|nr:flagellar rod assembly protein FlgJ [Salmonella enterica subsp. enterica]
MIGDGKLLASAAWDAQSLNELKAKAGQDPAANIRPVARQVEGMFVQMMLKSMREALPKDGYSAAIRRVCIPACMTSRSPSR